MVCWVTSPIFHHPESRIRIMNVSFFFSAMCYPPLNQTLFTVESEARIRFPDFNRCRTILTGQNGRTQKQGNRWRRKEPHLQSNLDAAKTERPRMAQSPKVVTFTF